MARHACLIDCWTGDSFPLNNRDAPELQMHYDLPEQWFIVRAEQYFMECPHCHAVMANTSIYGSVTWCPMCVRHYMLTGCFGCTRLVVRQVTADTYTRVFGRFCERQRHLANVALPAPTRR